MSLQRFVIYYLNHIQCILWTLHNVKCLYIYSLKIILFYSLKLLHKLDLGHKSLHKLGLRSGAISLSHFTVQYILGRSRLKVVFQPFFSSSQSFNKKITFIFFNTSDSTTKMIEKLKKTNFNLNCQKIYCTMRVFHPISILQTLLFSCEQYHLSWVVYKG